MYTEGLRILTLFILLSLKVEFISEKAELSENFTSMT